ETSLPGADSREHVGDEKAGGDLGSEVVLRGEDLGSKHTEDDEVRSLVVSGYDDFYRGHVPLVFSLAQQFSCDPDFFDGQLSLEEPVPNYLNDVNGVADRLSPCFYGNLFGSTVEVHHDCRCIGHQW